jgi:hypothetical protein
MKEAMTNSVTPANEIHEFLESLNGDVFIFLNLSF